MDFTAIDRSRKFFQRERANFSGTFEIDIGIADASSYEITFFLIQLPNYYRK